MPIDFEALVAPFRTAYFLQCRSITESMRNIAQWLGKRLKATVDRERETRGLQTFSFVGDALSIYIDPSQYGALGPQGPPPPQGFWANAAAPFVRFWRGLLLAKSMVEAEGVLPGVLGALADTVAMINASLDRFKTADRSLFDVSARKGWTDLFGELGLFFRLVNDPATVKQVQTFSSGGMQLLHVLRRNFPSKPSEEKQSEGGGGLVELTRNITGGMLAIPVAWEFVTQILRTASMAFRLKLLERAEMIQREVFDLRRDMIDFVFVTLNGIGTLALNTLFLLRSDLKVTLDTYVSFIKSYFAEIESWLKNLGTELKKFMDGMVTFIRKLGDFLELFMDIDIGHAVSYGVISFTPDDLLDPDKVAALQKKIDRILTAVSFLSPLGGIIIGALLRKRLKALREVLRAVGVSPQIPAEAALPDLSATGFPDIYQAFFGGKEAAILRSRLTVTGAAIQNKLDAIFEGGMTALNTTAEAFSKAASDAASMGSAKRYGLVANRAAALAENAFGADAARAGLLRRKDPIAEAYESWLSASGFNLLGKVLPAYVAEMIAFWKKEAGKPPADRPTSPAILARRERIDRVRLPRMAIRINEERELDKTLAAEIADRVRQGVARAFEIAAAQPEAAAG